MSSIPYPSYRNNRVTPAQVITALAVGAAIFVASMVVFVLGFQLWYGGRIYPGVKVGGVDVGGLTPQAAAIELTSQINFPQHGRIVLQEGQKTWMVTPAEMGLYLDPENSAARAYQLGRDGGLGKRLDEQFTSWSSGSYLAPAMIFDQRAAYTYLANLAKEIDTPVMEAGLGVEGTEVIVRSGQRGRSVDMDATLQAISQQITLMQDGVVPIVVKETAPVILDATEQAEKARQILSQPLTLALPDGESGAGPWVFDQQTLAAMLNIERRSSADGAEYAVGLNSEMLVTFLSNLAPELQRYPQNARFIFNDDTLKLDVLEPSVRGRTLDVEATLKAVREKTDNGEHTVPLVFQYQEPQVSDQKTGEELGITELVHAETSYFYGSSADRVQNITTAASRFHGLLVAPGETFSMATALGDISLDNGYAEALIIVGGQTVQGVGGGVCQVSTTLFRAAFFGGYPILERHSHAYRVGYYEKISGNRRDSNLAGMDATVFVPLVDFKFRNDTPYYLLMETYVNPSNSSITWKFYSTGDGRTVEWNTTGPVNTVEAPEAEYKENPELSQGEIRQVDWAAEGADVTVQRTVLRDGQVWINDTFYTHYEPWRAVYEYGPGTEIPTGEPEDESH